MGLFLINTSLPKLGANETSNFADAVLSRGSLSQVPFLITHRASRRHHSTGAVKMKGPDRVPSGLRTVRVTGEPGVIFLPAFLHLNRCEKSSSFAVTCASPFNSTTAPI